MNKMKKALALLAASAVSVSMFAFAGCGSDDKTDAGAIPGNYEEKTPEELQQIINNIDSDKIFGGNTDNTTPAAPATVNMGVKVDLSGGFAMGDVLTSTESIKMDYKMSANEETAVGAGTVAVKANYMSMMSGTKQEQAIDFSGNVYNDTQWVYAASGNDKVKINMETLIAAIGGAGGDDKVSPASYYKAESGVNIASVLAMAKVLNIAVTVDDSNGLKIKLSASEETIWSALSLAADEIKISVAQITAIKSMVTFNSFKFDTYFALDKEGAFAGASVVMDIDATLDASFIADMMAESAAPAMLVTAQVKGSVELYVHNETVTVPDTVTDGNYADKTEDVLAMISNMGK